MMPQLGPLELFVADPLESRKFYCKLGFEPESEEGWPHNLWLKCGWIQLLLRRAGEQSDPPANYQASRIAMVFYTPDLPATLARLAAQGIVPRGIDGSEKCPTIVDPDGNWIQLVDPEDH